MCSIPDLPEYIFLPEPEEMELSELVDDVLFSILAFLPVSELWRFRIISARFKTLCVKGIRCTTCIYDGCLPDIGLKAVHRYCKKLTKFGKFFFFFGYLPKKEKVFTEILQRNPHLTDLEIAYGRARIFRALTTSKCSLKRLNWTEICRDSRDFIPIFKRHGPTLETLELEFLKPPQPPSKFHEICTFCPSLKKLRLQFAGQVVSQYSMDSVVEFGKSCPKLLDLALDFKGFSAFSNFSGLRSLHLKFCRERLLVLVHKLPNLRDLLIETYNMAPNTETDYCADSWYTGENLVCWNPAGSLEKRTVEKFLQKSPNLVMLGLGIVNIQEFLECCEERSICLKKLTKFYFCDAPPLHAKSIAADDKCFEKFAPNLKVVGVVSSRHTMGELKRGVEVNQVQKGRNQIG